MQPRSRTVRSARVFLSMLVVSTVGLTACSEEGDSSAPAPAATAAAAAESTAPAATETTVASATTVAGAPAVILTASPGNIVYTAVSTGDFLTLASLLAQADMVGVLKGPGPFTVFAPTDAAFAKVPKETLAAVAADPELLKKVLLYHVVPGRLQAKDLKAGDLATAAGPTVKLGGTAEALTVNDAKVAAADVIASNGVIHVIDSVLLPPA